MQGRAYNFLIIIQIARDYNVIPITSTPAKHIFNITRNLISKKQTRIASENIYYVLCLRS
jgi:hAT family C-terminal dimerisation region